MKIRCSWCGRDVGEKPSTANETEAVTHGICPDCLARVMEDWRGHAVPLHDPRD